jgi:2-polyprenyl-3-methyl-5-hydroxy-6-metoxy-1,4-benzoquinol methylase
MTTGEHYDKIYKENKEPFGGGRPLALVEQIPSYMQEGRVLDIGAGTGRNSIYLAEKGFRVDAVISQVKHALASNK